MTFDEILDYLKSTYKLDHLDHSTNKPISLIINDETVVYLSSIEKGCFTLYTAVCSIPSHDLEQAYRYILEKSLFGLATYYCSFGIDKKTNQLILYYNFIEEPKDANQVINKINELISVAQQWQSKIKNGRYLD